jgi:hypothetical protein
MMKGPPPDRGLPFDVAPEVAALVGDQELRLLARQAAAGPFECVACGREGTAGKAATAAVAIRARRATRGTGSASPPGRELTLLRLAHTSCLRSQVIDSDEVLEPGDAAVNVSTAVLAGQGVPQPFLLLDFVSGISAAPAGPDGRSDMLISMLLEEGMTLVSDLQAPLPHAPRLSVMIRRGKLSVQCQGRKPLVEEMKVIKAPGWRRAVKAQGEVTVLAGTALGLHAGFDGLGEAVRAAHVAGARVSVSS